MVEILARNTIGDEVCERILKTNPDAVFVLSGGIAPSENSPFGFKSTPYGEPDHVGFFGGGKARVIAAAQLAGYFPNTPIVTNSTVLTEQHALIYAAELRAMGVLDGQIVEQTRSNSTATELLELLRMIKEKGWQTVLVVTNDYHIERAEVMLSNLEKLFTPEYDEATSREVVELIGHIRSEGVKIVFQDAEGVLRLRSPHYAALISAAKATDAYAARLRAEAEGIAALREGRYKLRPLNKAS